MPVEFLAYVVSKTTWLQSLASNRWSPLYAVLALLTVLTYRYSQGTRNPYDAKMHGKVILLTGGTSGIGAAVARDLASRGAQIVFLVRSIEDGWTQEFITTLRKSSGNEMLYAEECNLSSLPSVRKFATRWIDNSPVRRLDQVILCAGVTQPVYADRSTTLDGVEVQFGTIYLANYLLLSILSPALRAQPSERDVRVIVTTCTSYILGAIDLQDFEFQKRGYPSSKPWQAFGAAKLYLMAMTKHLQRLIDDFERPDKLPSRVKCLLVDPGLARTSSFRRFVSFGTLFGLFVYILTYPIWYVIFKSAENAAETILFASMAPSADVGGSGVRGGELLQECRVKNSRRAEIDDPKLGEALWKASEQYCKEVEKRSTLARKANEKADRDKHKAKADQESKQLNAQGKSNEQPRQPKA